MTRSRGLGALFVVAAAALPACSGAGASGAPPGPGGGRPGAAASAATRKSGPFAFLRSHKKDEHLASGVEITLRVRDTISSRTNKSGDAVVATAVRPALSAAGDTVIPAGAVFEGVITDIAPSPNPRSEGRLAIEFSQVRYGGSSHPVRARLLGAETERVGRGITGGTALKVGAGAGVGGLAGRLIGGNATGTIVGAAAGAAAGGVYAHETRHLDVVLPRGGQIRIALTEPFGA